MESHITSFSGLTQKMRYIHIHVAQAAKKAESPFTSGPSHDPDVAAHSSFYISRR
jgi:hypothetical protein